MIYNLIKLPFLLIYRVTFDLIEHTVGIIKLMCCLFRGDAISDKVNAKEVSYANEFYKIMNDNAVLLVRFAQQL